MPYSSQALKRNNERLDLGISHQTAEAETDTEESINFFLWNLPWGEKNETLNSSFVQSHEGLPGPDPIKILFSLNLLYCELNSF